MIDPQDKQTQALDLVDADGNRPALRLVLNEPPAPAVVVPATVADDGPMDAAARQRKVRAKRKQLAEEKGLKAIWLLEIDRVILRCGLDLFRGMGPMGATEERLYEILQKLEKGAEWFPDGGQAAVYARQQDKAAQGYIRRIKEAQAETSKWARRARDAEAEVQHLGDQSEAEQLRRQLAAARRENELLESERNKANQAVRVFEDRLRAAKLSTDYRAET